MNVFSVAFCMALSLFLMSSGSFVKHVASNGAVVDTPGSRSQLFVDIFYGVLCYEKSPGARGYQYDDLKPDSVNVPVTLAKQCNCEPVWVEVG